MGLVRVLDVILIDDETVRPPKPKFVVCIEPDQGWFYRINSKGHWRPCVPLVRIPDHMFLDHDSFIECGDPLELDDYIIETSLERRSVIGSVSRTICAALIDALAQARYLKEEDRAAIRAALAAT